MNRLKKRVNGGIQQKMFSLVFLTILLIIAAFAVVIVWQSFQLRDLVTNTNARQ